MTKVRLRQWCFNKPLATRMMNSRCDNSCAQLQDDWHWMKRNERGFLRYQKKHVLSFTLVSSTMAGGDHRTFIIKFAIEPYIYLRLNFQACKHFFSLITPQAMLLFPIKLSVQIEWTLVQVKNFPLCGRQPGGMEFIRKWLFHFFFKLFFIKPIHKICWRNWFRGLWRRKNSWKTKGHQNYF